MGGQRRVNPAKADARKKFQGYKPEFAKKALTARTRARDDRIFRAYKDASEILRVFGDTDPEKRKKLFGVLLRGCTVSQRQIQEFLIHSASIKDAQYLGFFLDHLVESSNEDSLHLRFDFLPVKTSPTGHIIQIDGLGRGMKHGTLEAVGDIGEVGILMQGGTLVVHGNVEYAGEGMEAGKIIIHGNCEQLGGGAEYGALKGGEIVVEGDAGQITLIEGGKIHVKGNVGILGWDMYGGIIIVDGSVGTICPEDGEEDWDGIDGGEVHIKGDIGSMGEIEHGKIFHKGKLIVDK